METSVTINDLEKNIAIIETRTKHIENSVHKI